MTNVNMDNFDVTTLQVGDTLKQFKPHDGTIAVGTVEITEKTDEGVYIEGNHVRFGYLDNQTIWGRGFVPYEELKEYFTVRISEVSTQSPLEEDIPTTHFFGEVTSIDPETGIKYIFSDQTTIAILSDGGGDDGYKGGSKGIAKCNPEDEYSQELGKKLATKRARIKAQKKKIKDIQEERKKEETATELYFNGLLKNAKKRLKSLQKEESRLV